MRCFLLGHKPDLHPVYGFNSNGALTLVTSGRCGLCLIELPQSVTVAIRHLRIKLFGLIFFFLLIIGIIFAVKPNNPEMLPEASNGTR